MSTRHGRRRHQSTPLHIHLLAHRVPKYPGRIGFGQFDPVVLRRVVCHLETIIFPPSLEYLVLFRGAYCLSRTLDVKSLPNNRSLGSGTGWLVLTVRKNRLVCLRGLSIVRRVQCCRFLLSCKWVELALRNDQSIEVGSTYFVLKYKLFHSHMKSFNFYSQPHLNFSII